MKNYLFIFFIFVSSTVCSAQNKQSYYPEYFMKIIGRTDVSPELEMIKSDFNLTENLNENKVWKGEDITLHFTNDEAFGKDLHLVDMIDMNMILKNRVNQKMFLENGILGATPGMKKKKVEELLSRIDPSYKASETKESKFIFKKNTEVVFHFSSAKPNGILQSVTLKNVSNLIYILKDNFLNYGYSELVPNDVLVRYNTNSKYYYYINSFPNLGCKSCIYNANNATVDLKNGKSFNGKVNGLGVSGTLTIKEEGKDNYFSGNFIYGEAQGKGKLIFADGNTIIGYWKNGLIYKTDRMDMDGLNYIGEVKPDFTMHGMGILISEEDGISVEGRFENHNYILTEQYKVVNTKEKYSYVGIINSNLLPNGTGKIIWDNGESQTGSFENGKFLGGSTALNLEDGSEYRGEVNGNNSPHGKGGFYYTDGTFYEGTFLNGTFQGGKGKLNYGEGAVYEGPINKSLKPEGTGLLIYSDGGKIKGTFSSDGKFLKGNGKKVFKEGIYTGDFGPDIILKGKGNFTFNNHQYVNGNFSNNKFENGTGKIFFNNGQRYEGSLNGDYKPDGYGTQYFSDKEYVYGYFKDGLFTASNGTRLWSNGAKFVGPLNAKGEPYGYGTFTSPYASIKGNFHGTTAIGKVEATYYSYGNTWIWSGEVDANLKPHGSGKAKKQYSNEWKNITYNHGVEQ